MNTQTEEAQTQLFERARAVDFCSRSGIVLRGSQSITSENSWRGAVQWASDAEFEQLLGHVKAAEVAEAKRRAWESDLDAARERRNAPMSEQEQADFNQMAIEAAAAAQEAARPATRGQLDTLIGLQRDILAALTKR